MSLIGGYHIVNLKNIPLTIDVGTLTNGKDKNIVTNELVYIEDAYYNLINCNAKMVILSGLNLNGVCYRDYEVLFYDNTIKEKTSRQCILRRMWNTNKKFYITYYLDITEDNGIILSADCTCYETLPDNSFSTTSTNAVQNKIVTKKFNDVDAEIEIINDKLNPHIAYFTTINNADIRLIGGALGTDDLIGNIYEISQCEFVLSGDGTYSLNLQYKSIAAEDVSYVQKRIYGIAVNISSAGESIKNAIISTIGYGAGVGSYFAGALSSISSCMNFPIVYCQDINSSGVYNKHNSYFCISLYPTHDIYIDAETDSRPCYITITGNWN